jgi:hypothetical protein
VLRGVVAPPTAPSRRPLVYAGVVAAVVVVLALLVLLLT